MLRTTNSAGRVRLVQGWGNDKLVVIAARESTSKDFRGWGTPEAPGDEKFIRFLLEHQHTGPFEHCGVTLEVRCPLFITTQWLRHRTQSFSVKSARYVMFDGEYWLPTSMEAIERAHASQKKRNKQAKGEVPVQPAKVAEAWVAMRDAIATSHSAYEQAVDAGMPREMARGAMPYGAMTDMIASANLLNWLRFLKLRDAPDAQEEIRVLAVQVRKILHKKFPRTMQAWEELRREELEAKFLYALMRDELKNNPNGTLGSLARHIVNNSDDVLIADIERLRKKAA